MDSNGFFGQSDSGGPLLGVGMSDGLNSKDSSFLRADLFGDGLKTIASDGGKSDTLPESSWCESCQVFLDGPCVKHSTSLVADHPALARAYATVPLQLRIESANTDPAGRGVFARVRIPSRTVFGPLIAPLRALQASSNYPRYFLREPDGILKHYDLECDFSCNWMKFVRSATQAQEQNLVVYAQNGQLYFAAKRLISTGEELKVWYGRNYGAIAGLSPLLPRSDSHTDAVPDLVGNSLVPVAVPVEITPTVASAPPAHPSLRIILSVNRKRKQPDEPPREVQEVQPPAFTAKRVIQKNGQPKKANHVQFAHKCAECTAQFRSAKLLCIHNLKHTGINGEMPNEKICPGCEMSCETWEELIVHVDRHGKRPSIYQRLEGHLCDACGKYFATIPHLENHRKNKHIAADYEKTKECNVCHEKFSTTAALGSHKRTHVESNYFECVVCRIKFANGILLKEHSESHCVDGQYPCPSCEKAFPHFQSLKRHIRDIHPLEAALHVCSSCQMVFHRLDRLRAHMVVHSNVAEFMCEICGKRFKRKDKLKDHKRRVHNPEKVDARKVAPTKKTGKKSGEALGSLTRTDRARQINEESVYRCRLCQIGFRRRGMLINHYLTKHAEIPLDSVPELATPVVQPGLPFPCEICEYEFASPVKRKAHVKEAHSDQVKT